MARDVVDLTPIESRDELVAWFAEGAKPKAQWRAGTEHEKFAFTTDTHEPVPYEGRRSIRSLLVGMQHLLGWEPIMDGPNIIGLADVTGGGAISLEPGGQFELSGAPLQTIHQSASELTAHLAQLREIARPLGIGFLGLGMSPQWTREQTPRMPKSRYKIMTAYMPKVGRYGLDMMYRTCTVQTNLDFSSEADMVKKLRVSLALQPVATALFANSPFTEGKPNGYLSFRSEVWTDTDNQRAGMLPFAFEDGMGFERYVDYALDVPMYFVKREDEYIDTSGLSFRDLLKGKLPGHGNLRATQSDWANHVSTIFPEVRLKRYLEMRGADSGPWARLDRAAGVLGRPALRRCLARCRMGHGEGLERRAAADAARRGAAARAQCADSRACRARSCEGVPRALRSRPEAARFPRQRSARRDALSRAAAGDCRARDARRRRSCSRSIPGRGAGRSTRCLTEYAY